MSEPADGVEFSALPDWADRFVRDLDDRFGVLSGDRAEKNFPRGEAPPWLRGDHDGGDGSPPDWLDSFLMDGNPDLQRLWMDEGFLGPDPEWLAELHQHERADVARVFMLVGNVHDYAFSPHRGFTPVIDRLERSAAARKDWVVRYSLSNGFSDPIRGDSTPADDPTPFEVLEEDDLDLRDGRARSPQEALDRDLQVIERLLGAGYDGGVSVIVDNLQLLVPPDSTNVNRNVLTDAIQRWAQSPEMFRSENQVVLLADGTDSLNDDLRSGTSHVDTIEVPRPETAEARLKFLTTLFTGSRVDHMPGVRLDAAGEPVRFSDEFGDRIDEKLATLANRTSGLDRVGLENLVLQARSERDGELTMEYVTEAKRDLLSEESGGLLQVTEPDPSTDPEEAFAAVGGLEPVRRKLLTISELLDEAGDSEMVRRSLPNGLLFLGPPGTGKTMVARAFANACGVNFAEFGDIRSMWVGESERNLSRALELIRSLKPVVVFMDEIDQSLGQRGDGTGSGVDQRLFARILQFMSDPELEGEVIWIGASNEPHKIDPALKRAGRFDLTIPFLRPDAEARRAILEVNFGRREATPALDESDWAELVERTEGYTGAELERVAKEAVWNHLAANGTGEGSTIPAEAVLDALETYQPPANRSEYRRMEDEALEEVTAVDLLPDRYKQRRRELGGGEP
ncbi:hypothetical protein GCM10027435_08590 [Haloparvum alkalitolerans]|uniref:ATP-binding protein n=1 Tax=Haloparvum alkalitolerans TaxID=1042953 RepID=UPI003CF5C2A7